MFDDISSRRQQTVKNFLCSMQVRHGGVSQKIVNICSPGVIVKFTVRAGEPP